MDQSTLSWKGPDVHPDNDNACIGIVRHFNTYDPMKDGCLYLEIVYWRGSWSIKRGFPEEGDGRQLVRWAELPLPGLVVTRGQLDAAVASSPYAPRRKEVPPCL